jgi:hypothetical protein
MRKGFIVALLALAAACSDSSGSSPSADAGAGTDGATSTPPGAPGDSGTTDDPSGDAAAGGGLASKYPCDEGIAADPSVVFTESFEEGTVSAITARYESSSNPAGMALVADVPPKSCGKAALELTSGAGANATDLYKKLPNADEWYVRWYAKYQKGISWHHSGVWFGGYAPALDYPFPNAGLRPNGDDRFSLAIEPVYGVGTAQPRLDTYDYWMKMHSYMDQPSGDMAYYGTAVVNQAGFTVDEEQWMCIEVHAKVNPDPGSGAGAVLEIWKNDGLVQSFTDASPVGYWVKDKFCPDGATGPECVMYPAPPGTTKVPLDMQVRGASALALNYFWPQNYITDGPDGSLSFDDVVIAKTRIGCLR